MCDANFMFKLYLGKFVRRTSLIGISKPQNREKIGINRDGGKKEGVYVRLNCQGACECAVELKARTRKTGNIRSFNPDTSVPCAHGFVAQLFFLYSPTFHRSDKMQPNL